MRFLSASFLVLLVALSSAELQAQTGADGTGNVQPDPTKISDEEFLAMTPDQRAAYLASRKAANVKQVNALSALGDGDFDTNIKAAKNYRCCGNLFRGLWTFTDLGVVAGSITYSFLTIYAVVELKAWAFLVLGGAEGIAHFFGMGDDYCINESNNRQALCERIANDNARAILHLEELERNNLDIQAAIDDAVETIMNGGTQDREEALRFCAAMVRGYLRLWQPERNRDRIQHAVETAIANIIDAGPQDRHNALRTARDIVHSILRPIPPQPLQPPVDVGPERGLGDGNGNGNGAMLERYRTLHVAETEERPTDKGKEEAGKPAGHNPQPAAEKPRGGEDNDEGWRWVKYVKTKKKDGVQRRQPKKDDPTPPSPPQMRAPAPVVTQNAGDTVLQMEEVHEGHDNATAIDLTPSNNNADYRSHFDGTSH